MSDANVDALTAAVARVQGKLPRLRKGRTGQVGNQSYKYTDLGEIHPKIFPLLAAEGLAWVTKPTLHEGAFVLAYSMKHVSGQEDPGYYPLSTGTPQQVGSAITYARRYSLCAYLGLVADNDDDGRAASQPRQAAPQRQAQPRATATGDDGRMTRAQVTEHNKLAKDDGPVRRAERGVPDEDPWATHDPDAGADTVTGEMPIPEWSKAGEWMGDVAMARDIDRVKELWHELAEAGRANLIPDKQRERLRALYQSRLSEMTAALGTAS